MTSITCIDYIPSTDYVAIGLANGVVIIYDYVKGQQVKTISAWGTSVSVVKYVMASHIAIASTQYFKIWNYVTNT